MKSLVLVLMSLFIVSHCDINQCCGQKIKWRSLLPFRAKEPRNMEPRNSDPRDSGSRDIQPRGDVAGQVQPAGAISDGEPPQSADTKRRLFNFRPNLNLRPRDPSQPGLLSRMNAGTRHFFSSASRNVSDWARDTNRSIYESTQNSWHSLTGGLSRQLKSDSPNPALPRPSIRASDDSVQPTIKY